MGHQITAIIGKREDIEQITERRRCQTEELPQGFGMVYLTARLFDDIAAQYDAPNRTLCAELTYLTEAVHQFLREHSRRVKLAYIETDYAGGWGTQAGALYENGELTDGTRSGTGTVDRLLRQLGVRRCQGQDEFDSLALYQYRRMPEE